MRYSRVTVVEVVRPFVLHITFADGTMRDIDVESRLFGEVFQPLRDPSFFAKASVDPALGTVVWPNGADFSPEFLYSGGEVLAEAEST